jgi:large subunit ribosomal protein L21
MANKRLFLNLCRHYKSIFSPHQSLQFVKILPHFQTLELPNRFTNPFLKSRSISTICYSNFSTSRHFSSDKRDDQDDDDEEEDEDEDEDEVEDEDEESCDDEDDVSQSNSGRARVYTPEEKRVEAAAIGYKVIGPLDRSQRNFKPYEPVFAVVQIGSHQFKVSNGDCIYTEKLKHCEVNEKIMLNKILMLGSATQTIIGRPILPDASVYAVVEEHALDAKVIIFKKKRRKNYRRKNGHRQELTKLRIIDVQGIEKPEPVQPEKPEKVKKVTKKVEKVAVAA